MPQVALISDIHGNALALNAVRADLARDASMPIICLGDAIQGGPQPAQVVAQLRELRCPVVMGNADAWLLSGVVTEREPRDPERERQLQLVRNWSLTRLNADDRAFIAAFVPTVQQPLDADQHLLGFHGSPASFDDIILPATPEDEFRAHFAGLPQLVFTGGHTHTQIVRRFGHQLFINPGSVGLVYNPTLPAPIQTMPWAEYAVLTVDSGRVGVEFRRVPYDSEPLLAAYRTSGRPLAEQAIAQYQTGN